MLTGAIANITKPDVRLQEAAGIRLLTGATDTATFELMDDKAAFTAFANNRTSHGKWLAVR